MSRVTDEMVEACWRSWEGIAPDEGVMGPAVGYLRRKARAALEAALAVEHPTEDEREALALLIDGMVNADPEPMTNQWWIADAILAAGWRPPVPEQEDNA